MDTLQREYCDGHPVDLGEGFRVRKGAQGSRLLAGPD